MLAGGIAGLFFWTFFYPVDTLKTRLQSDNLYNPKYKNITDVYKQTVKSEGLQSLFKGITVCTLRSIPVSAFGLLTFEETKKYIEFKYSLKSWKYVYIIHIKTRCFISRIKLTVKLFSCYMGGVIQIRITSIMRDVQ